MAKAQNGDSSVHKVHTFCSLDRLANSPIHLEELSYALEFYPKREVALELKEGFTKGFRVGYTGPRIARDSRNHKSALERPDVIEQKLTKEVHSGRVAGPFSSKPLPNIIVSPIGLVEKTTSDEFRLIFDLSHPHNYSINDGIPTEVASVEYTRFDAITEMVQKLGRDSFLVKLDIESAFRLIPLHPDDFSLMGMQHQGRYYVDKALPFGCSSSCAIFEKFATFLEWGAKKVAMSENLVHYLDDFCGGEKSHADARALLEKSLAFFSYLGVPVAPHKVEGPSTCLRFLGLVVDTHKMEIRIPEEKLKAIQLQVESMLRAKKVTLRELQSLIGRMNFACRAIVPGRPFCRRLIDATKGIKRQHHRLRVTQSMKKDLEMWKTFLQDHNGRCIILPSQWVDNVAVDLHTDASGSIGFGAYFQGHWTHGTWPTHWSKNMPDITYKELYPIVLAVHLWSRNMQNKKILFHCDNQAVVTIINKQTTKSPPSMCLIRLLVLTCMKNNLLFRAIHLPGKTNQIADALSRGQFDRFRKLAQAADPNPTPIPATLQQLLTWR